MSNGVWGYWSSSPGPSFSLQEESQCHKYSNVEMGWIGAQLVGSTGTSGGKLQRDKTPEERVQF